MPRDSHAAFDPPPDRPDPISLLEEQGKSRVPELVPVRYGRMMVSPFTFFRGAALPMASDLAATPVSGLAVQACGDAHLSNFGLFGSAERRLMFDVNDFDETLPGPWEWDVKRLAASLEVAARGNGFAGKQRREIVTAAVTRYRQAMRSFAGMTNLEVWYAHMDMDQMRAQFDAQLRPQQRKVVDKGLAKARTRDSMEQLAKLTHVVDGQRRIIAEPPLLVPIDDLIADQSGRTALQEQFNRPARQVPAHPGNRPPLPARSVPVRRPGPQGRRRRQRRDPLLDRADARSRRWRPAVPSGERGRSVGAQPVRRRQQVHQPGPAGGRGPAADAGLQ